MGPSRNIPASYNALLADWLASDVNSLLLIIQLSKALRTEVKENGVPLLPAIMIRPKIFVMWNAAKGSVDEYSRALKTFAMPMSLRILWCQ